MKQPDDLLSRNRDFVRQMEAEDPDLFRRLSQGQKPDSFVLSCSDSRVSPSVITQSGLGTLFVHRNVANQAAPDDPSLEAGLYYALRHLGVKRVVVIGHTGCGGIAAAREGNREPELQGWLRHIRESLRPELETAQALSVDELARRNVLRQVERLAEHPVYQTHGKNVPIEGYLYHLESGRLELLTRREQQEPGPASNESA